ncbi:MAG: phosphoribosylamine--glycine ligase, partial [Comamonadaceae bacterium]
MRFLGIGEYNDLGAMYHRLAAEGHEVRVFVGHAAQRDVYAGLLDFTADWQQELGWLRAAGDDGVALFESALNGEVQDDLRRDGFQVVGGSAFGDRLEADRSFGQDALIGLAGPHLRAAATHRFTAYAPAIDFLRRGGGRFVLKFNGADSPRTRNYIGQMADATDMIGLLQMYAAHHAAATTPDFVLMQHVSGVEVGVGAYFNGE